MDTVVIGKLLKKFPCFKGVFPLDLIPQNIKFPAAVIVNTHASNKPGEHWVCIMIDKQGFGEYFDSFGLPPLHKEIVKFLNDNCGKNWKTNPIALQNSISTTCGHYCVLYVIFRCQGYTYDYFISKFGRNTLENDFIMNKIFGHYSFDI